MSNPFGGPFAGASPLGGNPLEDERNLRPCCPKCKAENFHAWTHQYGLTRRCNECGEEWSGGTLAAGKPDFSQPPPPPGVPVQDELPVVQYTGAAFRDPDKCVGDDDDW